MRTIKFRAWDSDKKQMIDSVGFTDSDTGRLWQREVAMVDDYKNLNSTNWIPMQFTGLLDKNGKEIYEGDILLVPDEDVVPVTDEGQGPIEPCDHIVPVEFRNGEFGFEVPKTDDGETGWHSFSMWNEYTDIKDIQVIGNIYENPELLTPNR